MISLKRLKNGNTIMDYTGKLITVNSVTTCVTCKENNNIYTSAGVNGIPLTMKLLVICFDFEYCLEDSNELISFIKDDIKIGLENKGAFVYIKNKFFSHILYAHELENILSSHFRKEIKPQRTNYELCQTL